MLKPSFAWTASGRLASQVASADEYCHITQHPPTLHPLSSPCRTHGPVAPSSQIKMASFVDIITLYTPTGTRALEHGHRQSKRTGDTERRRRRDRPVGRGDLAEVGELPWTTDRGDVLRLAVRVDVVLEEALDLGGGVADRQDARVASIRSKPASALRDTVTHPWPAQLRSSGSRFV